MLNQTQLRKSKSDRLQADVVVIGGGPAGTSCAISLARAGRKVHVLERSRYETVRVGETLPPAVCGPLAQLGVWEQFLKDRHIPSPGIISVWGHGEVYENDFISNPYGSGWHVDRCRFDEMLAMSAEDAGAIVHRSVNVTACTQQPSGDWLVETKCDNEAIVFQASFLVNAAGRRTSLVVPAGRAANEKISSDRLVGVVKFLSVTAAAERARDTRTLVEASENGWWYSAFLPEGRLVVAYMTDADLLPKGALNRAQDWQPKLEQVPHTRERVETCAQSSELRIVAANSYRRASIKSINYLMIGDAAAAFDPLSAQGIHRALEAGLSAASAIERHQGGNHGALDDYQDKFARGYAGYLRTRAAYYNQEKRWPKNLFWRRRQSL
jgi:flavin-dependent dehydrogenase